MLTQSIKLSFLLQLGTINDVTNTLNFEGKPRKPKNNNRVYEFSVFDSENPLNDFLTIEQEVSNIKDFINNVYFIYFPKK